MKKLIVLLFVFLACSNNITGIYESENAKTTCGQVDVEEYILQAGHLKMSSQARASSSASGWTNSGNVYVSDNKRAQYDLFISGSNTTYLTATDFGFSIPAGATINGVKVSVECFSYPSGMTTADINLVGVSTTRKTGPFLPWETTDTVYTYGGSTDLWGGTLTPDDINSSDFGFEIRGASNSPVIGYIDYVEIEVYFTEEATTIDESLTFGLSLGMSNTGDLGGTTINESLTFGLSLGISESAPQTINESISIGLNLGLYTGNNLDDAGIRCISTANDIYIRDLDIASLTETWKKDYQINKYADGHNSIYHKSAWRKTWTLLIHANDIARTFVTALRSDQNDINLFPLYKFDKSTFYKTRVDNRAPLYYYAGEGDGSKLFQVVFYEVA